MPALSGRLAADQFALFWSSHASILGLMNFIFLTSFWPCLRHGEQACLLTLPTAQAFSLLGALPPNPLFIIQYHEKIILYKVSYLQNYSIYNIIIIIKCSSFHGCKLSKDQRADHRYANDAMTACKEGYGCDRLIALANK